MAENGSQVVIVGAGFGGLWAAKALGDTDLAVRLIDKNNYHSFYPLLYQVAAAEVEPELIAQPVRRIVRDKPNVRFAMLEVQRIDLERRLVCGPDQEFHYDYLLLALGSTNHFFNTPGAEANSFTLKSIEEGTVLRNHILQCAEKAAKLPPEAAAERRRLLTFVIIGGGPTGVEFAGAISELLYEPLARDYPDMDLRQEAKVILLEAADVLLRGIGGDDYVRGRLAHMGVDVRVDSAVARIEPEAVVLASGESIPTATPVWTAGVRGASLADELPFRASAAAGFPSGPRFRRSHTTTSSWSATWPTWNRTASCCRGWRRWQCRKATTLPPTSCACVQAFRCCRSGTVTRAQWRRWVAALPLPRSAAISIRGSLPG